MVTTMDSEYYEQNTHLLILIWSIKEKKCQKKGLFAVLTVSKNAAN